VSELNEFILAENSSAAIIRGQNLSPMSIGQMYAVAQQIMGEHQGGDALENFAKLYEEDQALALIAAARTLHTISITQERRGLDARVVSVTKLLSACAYAMQGNFPSATAVLKEIPIESLISETELIAAALCNPSSIGHIIQSARLTGLHQTFIESLNLFLIEGNESVAATLRPTLETIANQTTRPLDAVLLASCRLALTHVIHLSVSRVRGTDKSHLMRAFVRQLVQSGRPCFLPPQLELLETNGFGRSTANGVVTLPTSGGKTLIAEFAIISALDDKPGLAIFVVPYVALGNQVSSILKRHFPAPVRVHSLFGGFKAGANLDPKHHFEVIVATPERLDAVLRYGDLYEHLRVVIFDEAHLIENGQRGARIEALITRLRMKQHDGCAFRVILLSAVLNDVGKLCEWLGPNTVHVTSSWRPTARRIAVWQREGRINWLYGNDPLRPQARQGDDSLVQSILPWPNPIYSTDKFAQIKTQFPKATANVSFLSRFLRELLGGPILIVCGTKPTTRELAGTLARELGQLPNIGPTVIKLIEVIKKKAPYLLPLAQMAERGVAFHNAAVPMEIRRLIEDAVRNREITFVCSTTTLAEGVDLPFRVTILFDWLMGYGDQQRPIAPLLFRNIAGRCGRAGEFVEGDTILFDNVFGLSRFTHDSSRRDAQRTIFADPSALESAIANDNLSTEEKSSVNAVISTQLLAAILEHPASENIDELFASNTYAAITKKSAAKAFKKAREELLDESEGEPFARAASPIKLTSLGQAANQTGLSASSCRSLLRFLSEVQQADDVIALSENALNASASFPEQNNFTLLKLFDGSLKRSYLSRSDIPVLLRQWLAGIALESMFEQLPKAQQSGGKVKPEQWVRGESESDYVAAQFDKFVELAEYTFAIYLPWILRACQGLSSIFPDKPASQINWSAIADKFETARVADLEAIDVEDVSG